MNSTSSLLTSLYGNSTSLGNASATNTPSASVAARVEQALAAQKGTVARLNASLSGTQAHLSGLGQLQSALAVFQHLAEGVAGSGLSTSASTSTQGVVQVTTSGAAVAGEHAIDVSQLAQNQILNSEAAASADSKIGTGAPATIKVTVGGATRTLTIDSRNNSLAGIASALKDAGIDASVLKSDRGSVLQVRSASGAAQSLSFSVTGDAAVKNLFSGLKESQAAQDALLTVDGKEVRSADNAVEGAVPGLTLNVAGKGQTKVTVAKDLSQVGKNVASFVAGFNALQDRLGALQKGELAGTNALKQVAGQLTQLVKTAGVDKLADIGITLDKDGKLALDDKKLKAAVAADPAAVAKLFTNDGKGIADQLDSKIDALTGSSGVIRREASQVGKELTTLTGKKAQLTQALTAQAQLLAQFYTQQEQAGSGGVGGASSLFDFFA
jgi:flagellar hook-associated protein 2